MQNFIKRKRGRMTEKEENKLFWLGLERYFSSLTKEQVRDLVEDARRKNVQPYNRA
jgi:hypothetical protein